MTYNEIDLLQNLTNPELPLNVQSYISVCQLLGSIPNFGITLPEFNSSYYKFKETLGTDLDRDYNTLTKMGSIM